MLLQRSKLAVTQVERPRLASPWLTALLGLCVGGVLVLSFPQQTLLARVRNLPPSSLTDSYLANLLRTAPGDYELRLLLASNQLRQNQFARARETLQPLRAVDEPALRHQAAWLNWQSLQVEQGLLAADNPRRAVLDAAMRRELRLIDITALPPEQILDMARSAYALGETTLAGQLLERVAAKRDGMNPHWYATFASEALMRGEYRAAADLYQAARTVARSRSEEKAFFRLAVAALQAANRPRDAITFADEHIDGLDDDPDILYQLATLARAARRPDLAEKYARRLLQLSLAEQWRRAQWAAASGVQLRQVGTSTLPAAGGVPGLPFDARAYLLGYDIFVENGKLEDAYQIAAAAVRQRPRNAAWRRRLAEVAEWTGRPAEALGHWQWLARSQGGIDAWQAVARLAPGLFDDAALVEALRYLEQRQPGDARRLERMVAALERLGEPREALALLQRAWQRSTEPARSSAYLRQLADLSERLGDMPLAIDYRRRLLAAEGGAGHRLALAGLLVTGNRPKEALDVLTAGLAAAGDGAEGAALGSDYWRLLGDLAGRLQRDDLALRAYRVLAARGDATVGDAEGHYQLLAGEDPAAAGRVALANWQRFGRSFDLLRALDHLAAQGDFDTMVALLTALRPEQRAALADDADFLRLSAVVHAARGDRAAAGAQFDAALMRAPDATAVRQAVLWWAIDSNDATALRSLLDRYEARWQADPDLHDGLAAAWLTLSLPQRALDRYLTPHLASRHEDLLWLMTYADALEQNGEAERAWQLRRQLFIRLGAARRTAAPLRAADLVIPAALARARLVLTMQPGDPAWHLLVELANSATAPRTTDAPAASRPLSPAARELLLAGQLSLGDSSAARGWLWQQYARHLSRPRWTELALALADNDLAAAGELLARHGEALPRADRIPAAQRLGAGDLAAADAFAAAEVQGHDAALHLQLVDNLLASADAVGLAYTRRDLGGVDEWTRGGDWHAALTPRLALDLELANIDWTVRDATVFATLPAGEERLGARLTWHTPLQRVELQAMHRQGAESTTGFALRGERQLASDLRLGVGAGVHLPASESTPLRIAGMSDRTGVDLLWQVSGRDRLRLEATRDRWRLQDGRPLGEGRLLRAEAGHGVRLAEPDLDASVFWSDLASTRTTLTPPLNPLAADATADSGFFVPDGFRFYGLRLSTGLRHAQERYAGRGLRPFASIATTRHSTLGDGYDLNVGVASTVFGADHLQIGTTIARNGTGSNASSREFRLTYRLHY